MRALLAIGLLAGTASAGQAAEVTPVKSASIYVTPYYDSGTPPSRPRKVAVGDTFNVLLASDKPFNIRRARDIIMVHPETVTPMTMMVLAARLYDIDERPDAVFWFYAATDRYRTLSAVVDMKQSQLAGIADAMESFYRLLGPTINSYAFCKIARQQKIRREAFEWVKANPYRPIFMPQLIAREPGDRRAAVARALAKIATAIDFESTKLREAKFRADFLEARRRNNADARFCWK